MRWFFHDDRATALVFLSNSPNRGPSCPRSHHTSKFHPLQDNIYIFTCRWQLVVRCSRDKQQSPADESPFHSPPLLPPCRNWQRLDGRDLSGSWQIASRRGRSVCHHIAFWEFQSDVPDWILVTERHCGTGDGVTRGNVHTSDHFFFFFSWGKSSASQRSGSFRYDDASQLSIIKQTRHCPCTQAGTADK